MSGKPIDDAALSGRDAAFYLRWALDVLAEHGLEEFSLAIQHVHAEAERHLALTAAQQQGQAVAGGEVAHEVEGVLREAQSLAHRINYSADHDEAVTLSADLRLLLQKALSIRTGLSLFRHPKWGGTAPPSVPDDLLRQAAAVLERFRTRDDDAITVINRINKHFAAAPSAKGVG